MKLGASRRLLPASRRQEHTRFTRSRFTASLQARRRPSRRRARPARREAPCRPCRRLTPATRAAPSVLGAPRGGCAAPGTRRGLCPRRARMGAHTGTHRANARSVPPFPRTPLGNTNAPLRFPRRASNLCHSDLRNSARRQSGKTKPPEIPKGIKDGFGRFILSRH